MGFMFLWYISIRAVDETDCVVIKVCKKLKNRNEIINSYGI